MTAGPRPLHHLPSTPGIYLVTTESASTLTINTIAGTLTISLPGEELIGPLRLRSAANFCVGAQGYAVFEDPTRAAGLRWILTASVTVIERALE
jgi:hypothetical protein